MNSTSIPTVNISTTTTTTCTSLIDATTGEISKGVTADSNSNGKKSKDTSFSYAYGSVCLLCLRTKTCTSVKSDPEKHRQSRLTCVKYVVLVSRYLKLNTELTKAAQKNFLNSVCELKDALGGGNNEIDFKEEINKFVICDICLPLASSFCKTYQEYELIQMKLEAKILESTACVEKSEVLGESLKVIRGIKRVAGPGAVKRSESGSDDDALIGFRSMLKVHGSKSIKLKEPKLQLKRDQKVEELVQRKIPKLHTNCNSTAKGGASEGTRKSIETATSVSQRPNTAVKIVRRSAGKKSEGPDISIIRLSKEPTVEDNNNESDIQIIGEVQKTSDNNPVVPRSIGVGTTTVPSYTIVSSPAVLHNNVLSTATRILLDPSVFQGNLISFPTTFQTDQSFVTVSTAASNMPSPVVPIQILLQQCNINGCGLTFPKTNPGLVDMQRHLNTHANLKCTKCTDVLNSPFELISHELKHDEANASRKVKQGFQCTRCPHYSMLRSEHQEHFLERHLNSKIELLKCQICKKGFGHLKQQQFQTHTSNCHPIEGKDDLSQCHSCMICRVYFKKKATLWKHLKNEHRICCKDGPHRCPDCSQSFSFQNLLNLHREFACKNKKANKCPYSGCMSMFTSVDLMNQHLEQTHAHHDNSLQLHECPVCKLQCSELETLKAHVMTHNGEQVKLVFADGDDQEPQVIPVENDTTGSSNSIFYGQAAVGNNVHDMSSNVTPPLPSPTPGTPIIVSVMGTPPPKIPTSVNTPSNSEPSNHCQPLGTVQAENNKLFEYYLDDSNDSEEHLMEFLENVISEQSGEDEVSQPEVDPFAWMLAEDFDIS